MVLETKAMDIDTREGRIELAAILRWAQRLGLSEGIANHFSFAPTPDTDQFLVNPFGYHWSEVVASDLVLVDKDGNILEGSNVVEETAFFLHSRLHVANPKARCVLHTHMPFATALCLLENGQLEMISQNAIRFYGRIAYIDEYNGSISDQAEGDRLVAEMGEHEVAFLGSHGVMVTGPTIGEAFDDLYYLERACQAQVIALSTGRRLRRLPDQMIRDALPAMQGINRKSAFLHLESIKRILDREEPEYASTLPTR